MSATPADRPLRIFVVAGEPSGDALGGGLMRALRTQVGDDRAIVFAGIGGEQMQAGGLESLFPLRELAVMGLLEVLPRVPKLARRLRETVDAVRRFKPDAVVTIDSSGFNKRLAKRLIAAGEPALRIHYVAPMVWAWRPNRVHTMAALFDHLLCLFPFEPPLFEAAGLASSFVGHPAVEAQAGDGPAFRAAQGIGPSAPLLCVLPGSRRSEVSRLLPVFGQSVARLARDLPGLRVVVPTVETVADMVRDATAGWAVPVVVTGGESAKADAFAASDVALAASGTVTLELAIAGLPTVVAYRMNPVTAWLARRLIRIPSASLPNILLQRPLVPELLQDQCTADALVGALRPLFLDPDAHARQRAALARAAQIVGDGDTAPSARAAEVVLALAARGRESHSAAPH